MNKLPLDQMIADACRLESVIAGYGGEHNSLATDVACHVKALAVENKRLQSHAKNAERAALDLKAKLEVEIERLESIIESLRGGTHCRFVGVPCGQCVGCNRDASVEKKIRG